MRNPRRFPFPLALLATLPCFACSSGAAAADTVLRLELNVPAFRIDAYVDGARVRSYPVAVGMPNYRTPRGAFTITELVWHPWWIPPHREWARNERPTPPGPRNPMGRVKFRFGALYYLHGTPEEQSIGRAASHGCVRMSNADAVDLARLVQRLAATPAAAESLETFLAESTTTRSVTLVRPVPLVVRYDAVEVRHDSLLLYPDIYRLAGDLHTAALAALTTAGVDARRVDTTRLRAALSSARRRAVSIPLDSLADGGRIGR